MRNPVILKWSTKLLLICLCCFGPATIALCQPQEEFNGPFASWANVKKRFGAKGDGKTDDTKALQNAIDGLADHSINYRTGANAYTTIYLPAGTYRISSTLLMRGKAGVAIVGEDPSRTIIKWFGGNKDTMLWANASAYFKISRISWHPNGKTELEAIGIHWKDKWRNSESRSYAPLNIEVSDCYFLPGLGVGVGGGSRGAGWTGHNDSEITIRRCRFFDCTQTGISINGPNALNYWVWDCQFINCHAGISVFAGNYHAYRCYFNNSKVLDFYQSNSYYTSVRWCYSENSSAFSFDGGNSCNPFKRIFQGNTVVNPKETPIEFYHLGRMTFFDNEFGKGKSAKQPFIINQNSWCPGVYAIMAINNKFSSPEPIRIAPSNKVQYLLNQRSLQSFTRSSTQFLSGMAKLPAKVVRPVYEVPRGASSQVIQSIIQKATARRSRAIVHFAPGNYVLDKTIVVPPNSDIQITGDGFIYSSAIIAGPRFPPGNPLILVKGPTRLVIKDIQLGRVDVATNNPALIITGADQKGARAFLDQIYVLSDTTLHMKGNNYLVVQKENSFFSDGNHIEGGRLLKEGNGTSKLLGFGGQFAGLTTSNNAEFVGRDIWWEGKSAIPLDLKGSGNITIDGAMIAPLKKDSLTTVRINRFDGRVSLMNLYLQGALEVNPDNPNLELMAWNINFYYKMNPLNFLQGRSSFKALASGFTAQCFDKNRQICTGNPLSFGEYRKNITDVDSFIMDMTKSDRENAPLQYTKLPQNISNIYLSRVTIGKCGPGVSFINESYK